MHKQHEFDSATKDQKQHAIYGTGPGQVEKKTVTKTHDMVVATAMRNSGQLYISVSNLIRVRSDK